MRKDTIIGIGISPSVIDRKTKWMEAFQNRLIAAFIGYSEVSKFLQKKHKHPSYQDTFFSGKIYSVIYNIVSFFWLYFYSSVRGDNEIHLARW